MRDPVTAEDGFVYQRSAIEKWLLDHSSSPTTGVKMGHALLPATQAEPHGHSASPRGFADRGRHQLRRGGNVCGVKARPKSPPHARARGGPPDTLP